MQIRRWRKEYGRKGKGLGKDKRSERGETGVWEGRRGRGG
jgi:hypothetical protein